MFCFLQLSSLSSRTCVCVCVCFESFQFRISPVTMKRIPDFCSESPFHFPKCRRPHMNYRHVDYLFVYLILLLKENSYFEAAAHMRFTGCLNIPSVKTETNTVVCTCRPVCPRLALMTRQSHNCGKYTTQLGDIIERL